MQVVPTYLPFCPFSVHSCNATIETFAFLKVDAEAYPVTVKVYGDGSVIYNATIASSGSAFTVTGATPSFSATNITEPVVRLPASMHGVFSVEIESAKEVHEVSMAESAQELGAV